MPEILTAFERALMLESELGVRTVDFDRALLAPLRAVSVPASTPLQPSVPVPAPETRSVSSPDTASVPVAAPQTVRPSVPSPVVAGMPTEAELSACRACPLAVQGRTRVIAGEGKTDAPDVMFIADAPDAEAVQAGAAFGGAPGALLAKMIAAMGYARADVFITHVCKCAPSDGRTPTAAELTACLPFLKRQIAAVRPKCLVLFGRSAMAALFPQERIRRGVWYMYEGIPVIATLHPKMVLRFDPKLDPAGLKAAKTEVWTALKSVLAQLGRTPPRPA